MYVNIQCTPTTKLNIAQKVFVPILQLFNSFRTPDTEQKI